LRKEGKFFQEVEKEEGTFSKELKMRGTIFIEDEGREEIYSKKLKGRREHFPRCIE
jgi:hypothetical protein